MISLISSKILSMVTLGVGSLISGTIPIWINSLSSHHYSFLLSCLLCCGGGVLLSTSLLHMLPEARESLPNNAEIALCGGFFFIYLIDELVHFLCGDKIDNEGSTSNRSNRSYEDPNRSHHHGHSHQPESRSRSYGTSETDALLNVEPDSCHVNHEEPCMRSKAGYLGIISALLIHSILEGLAIGLENSSSKVLLLLAAISSHKFVVGFCLGVELSATTRGKLWTHIVAVLIFSLGSVIGIAVGMLLEISTFKMAKSLLGVLQSLAAGTLLYVTVSEVLPRERAKWHHGRHYAGLVQLLSTLAGFALIYILNTYSGEH